METLSRWNSFFFRETQKYSWKQYILTKKKVRFSVQNPLNNILYSFYIFKWVLARKYKYFFQIKYIIYGKHNFEQNNFFQV